MPTITLSTGQIWLKGTGAASQVWSPTVSGLPAGAIINSVVMTFAAGNTYATPGRTSIYWGTSTGGTRLWSVSGSGGGTDYSVSLQGYVTGNGTFSLLFYKTANSNASQSNVYFTGLTITIDFTNPISTFSLDRTTLDAGTALGVTINRVDSSYTHKVTFAFGSRRYTATGVGTSVSYTIPVAWLDQIPNATSGTGTVTVETLSSAGTSMGSVSASFTLTAGAGVVPTVGTIKAEVVSGLDGLYIQGYSKCKVDVSGYAAGTGATVASVLITGNGDSAWAATMTSSLLRTAGTVTFTVKVTDSRGRATSGTVSITVQAYKAVAITGRTALRCKSDGTVSRVTGKSAKLGVSYTMTTVGSNAATVKVYWRVYGASSWTQISGWSSASGYTAVAMVDAVALDKRYEIRFDVADKLSMASQTAVIEPGVVYMVWSKVKSSFGLGTYPTGEKQVAIAEDWSLMLGSMDVGKAIRQRDRVRNLLDNSDFRNPVNQRGASSYTGWIYGIDRWIAIGPYVNVSLGSGITVTITASSTIQYGQYLSDEAWNRLKGKPFTFALCTSDGAIHIATGTMTSGSELYDSLQIAIGSSGFKMNIYKDQNARPMVRIFAFGESTITILWAALYEGAYTADTLPPYVPKGYGAELTECRRYYRRNEFLSCVKTSGNYFSVSKSIEMRAVPTVTLLTFAPYGSPTITDMSGCSVTIAQSAAGVQRITYATLPTCSAYSAGGLSAHLSADL